MLTFDIADRSQLFVDRVLVNKVRNAAFTLHPARKHPDNPIVRADRPWEGWRLEIYGTVIHDCDDHIYKMWYLGEERDAFPHYAAYYATSKDGVHWEKPLVGTVRSDKYQKHNVVAEQVLIPSVIKDNADLDPSRRYKMICWLHEERTYHTLVSRDGLHWTRHSKEPICRGADVITGYYDERRAIYIAFPKIVAQVRGHDRRVFWLITSRDFDTWTKPKLVLTPDVEDDASAPARIEEVRSILDVPDDPALIHTDFYGIGAYPAESCTLAFIWLFTINNNARYGNQEGPGELQLAVSRDLEHWERPFRAPCVPRGRIGEWDCGFFCTQSRALEVGDEVWLYYTGSNYTHGTPCLYRSEGTGRLTRYTGSIGLAIWQRDRFVSVDGPADGGWLETVPVRFTGNHLELNARTKPEGSVVVHLLEPDGNAIQGFERSEPVAGDNLRHIVTWKAGNNVASLAGRRLVLRFEIKDAELFAFAFRKN